MRNTSNKFKIGAFVAVLAILATFASCKPKVITPTVPEDVLPKAVHDEIVSKNYMTFYEGSKPPKLEGQFISKPHILIHASYDPTEDGTEYNDRYIAFSFSEKTGVDFWGKQWDDSLQDAQGNYYAGFYEEHESKLNISGDGNNFSCYYTTEGYPDGMYAKQSTIFSGTWDKEAGIRDFKIAVVLVETSDNPNLEPCNSYRILGDSDGLAEIDNWMGKSSESNSCDNRNAFNLFRKR